MFTFKTVKQNAVAEIVEKKSKFIAHVFYVETIEEAEVYIKSVKKQYNDARHNCYAYAIETDDEGIAIKYNDDKEPAGTAGAPILKMVLEQGLSNILVVVTRYFGGILLGTGGLVKAYTESAKKAIENAEIIEKTNGYELSVEIDYNQLEPLKYYLNKNNIKILNIKYSENINIEVEIVKELLDDFTNNYNKNSFNIINYKMIKKKFVEI